MKKLLKGSRLDELPIDQLEGTWRNARNIVINRNIGSITNEDGVDNVTPFEHDSFQSFPAFKKVIGCIVLNEEKLFFFGTTTPSDSEIGIVDADNNYRVILKGNPLNFNENFPIQGTFERKFNGNLVIGWTDFYNRIRILNVDCIPFKVNPDGTIPLAEQLKADVLISLFPDNLTPIINRRNLEVTENGGFLLSGVYHLVFSYGLEDGSFLNYGKIFNAIPVYVDDKKLDNSAIGGCIGGLATSKSIELTLDNVDTNFKYLKVAYLYLKNGVLSASQVKIIIINNQPSIKFTITGAESSLIQLSTEEILIPNVIYEKCKTITNLEKVLYLGNVKEPDDFNYQNFANEIEVKFHRGMVTELYDPLTPGLEDFLLLNFNNNLTTVSSALKAGYKNETTVFFDKSFRSNEVYALYITLHMKNGLPSKDFHIPGRQALGGEFAIINGIKPDYNDLDNGNPIYYYQCIDTSLADPLPREGLMGYWENENEKYPLNDAGTAIHPDFANIPGVVYNPLNDIFRNVRHHMFPSVAMQCEKINQYNGNPPLAGSAGEFFISAPLPNYYKQQRGQPSVAPTSGNEYDLDFSVLQNAVGTPLYTYTAIGGPTRAQYNGFVIAGIFKITLNLYQNLDSSRVGQVVTALNGYWRIRLSVYKNAVLFTEYELEINNQILTASNFPSISTVVNVPVIVTDTVVINYNLYTSLGTAVLLNPFFYQYFWANLNVSLGSGEYEIFGKPLGIKISNVNIPPALLPLVDSWEIKYAKRTNENIRMIAQDMLKRARFYNFDLENTKLPIKPSYLQAQVGYVINGVIAEVNDLPEAGLTAVTQVELPIFDNIESVSKWEYIGENTTSLVDNSLRADNIYVVAGSGQTSPSYIFNKFGPTNTLCDIVVYKRNMYMNFQNQELLTTGISHKITASGVQVEKIIFGGDIYVCPFGFRDMNSDNYVRHYVAEFVENVMLRRDDVTLSKTYFPKSSLPTLSWYGYNKDFNCLNPYNSQRIHYPVKDCLDTIIYHPNRIARSIPESTESAKINWRVFKANAYYDTIRNKGEIWNLLGENRTLYIHLKSTLLVAQIKDRISTNTGEIFLGVSDIFERPPVEAIASNEGYGGNQSQYATIICKIGYCFIDRNQGKLFVYSEGRLSEISDEGWYNFFKDNSEYTLKDIDNPFIGLGYTMCFDREYNRLIIVKKTNDNIDTGDIEFTASFSPDIKGWICQHDYSPNFILYNRSGLYAIDNSPGSPQLFLHNSSNNKCIFYDGVKKESYIEYVDNDARDKTKGYETVNWITSIRQGTVDFAKETITHLIVYNNYQCSGKITLSIEAGLWYNQDARNVQQSWSFNNFRDIIINQDNAFLDIKNQLINTNLNSLKEWFEQSKFISKFVVVRLIHDNQNQKEVNITLVGTTAKLSNR